MRYAPRPGLREHKLPLYVVNKPWRLTDTLHGRELDGWIWFVCRSNKGFHFCLECVCSVIITAGDCLTGLLEIIIIQAANHAQSVCGWQRRDFCHNNLIAKAAAVDNLRIPSRWPLYVIYRQSSSRILRAHYISAIIIGSAYFTSLNSIHLARFYYGFYFHLITVGRVNWPFIVLFLYPGAQSREGRNN